VDGNVREQLLGQLMRPPMGPATHYVCHAWNGSFAALLDTLEQYAVMDDACFWLDAFAVPQHHPTDTLNVIRQLVDVLSSSRYFLLCGDLWGAAAASPVRRPTQRGLSECRPRSECRRYPSAQRRTLCRTAVARGFTRVKRTQFGKAGLFCCAVVPRLVRVRAAGVDGFGWRRHAGAHSVVCA
jgi:hypothetical protein